MDEAFAQPTAEQSPSGARRLPTPDDLFLFLQNLRQQGYHIDPAQIAAAERLLIDGHAGGPESDAARRLKFRLVPVIAKTADEQEDLYRQFDRWRGLSNIAPTAVLPPKPPGPASKAARRDPRLWVAAAAIAAVIGLGAATTWYLWPPPSPPPPHPEATSATPSKPTDPGKAYDLPPEQFVASEEVVSPFYAGAKAALTAVPIILFLGWLMLRWRRRAVWMSRGVAVLDGELASVPLPVNLSQVLFAGPEFRGSAQDLRKHRYRPTRQLNVRKTVDATAAGAGLFCPIYRERPQLPEYIFLIEQNGSNDHLARLFDLAVERLQAEDVFIQRYYFHTDPRQVQADDAERTPVPLADLLARTHDHSLFVIATADGFLHPLTGEVEGWVRRLEPWRSRTLLSTRPLEQWTVAELRLLEEGFSLATAEASGFAAVGEKIAGGSDEPELLEGVIVAPVQVRKSAPPPTQPRAMLDLAVFRDVDAPWCPELVALPPGVFLMGSPKSEKDRFDDEGPQHQVTIGRRFAIGRYPVTFDEYDHFCSATGRAEPQDEGWGRGRRPVINVSWRDALTIANGWRERPASPIACRRRRSGSTRAAPARRRAIRGGTPSRRRMRTMRNRSSARRARLAPIRRTRGVFTTCTATSGSGWRTSGTTATKVLRAMARRGRMEKEYNPPASASAVAAPGAIFRGTAARRSAAGAISTSGAASMGSALPGRFLRTLVLTALPLGVQGRSPWTIFFAVIGGSRAIMMNASARRWA